MMRTARILVSALCVLVIWKGNAASAGGEFVAIDLIPRVRTLLYTPSEFPTGTIFIGEPIEFVVAVHNNTSRPIAIDGAALFDRVTIEVGRKGQATRDQLRVRRVSGPAAELRALAPGRQVDSTFSAETSGTGIELQAGVYMARVALPASAIRRTGRTFNDSLSGEISFEVRSHTTELEGWDYLLHRAYRAKLENRNAEEQWLLEELLRRNPASIPALADLGQMWRLQRDCARARPSFQRAIDLLATGSDAELLMSQTAREDWISGLRSLLSSCQ